MKPRKFLHIAIVAALFLTATVAWAADAKVTEEEKTLLTLILSHPNTNGGYAVIFPTNGFSHARNTQENQKYKKYLTERLQTNGLVLNVLVDRLFDRNKTAFPLSIQSSLKNGYLIDFDGKYEKYFKKNGGGWEKWYKEHPKADGMTTVSLPVYDHQTGLLLVYYGHQYQWLAGAGYIILYRYDKGKLTEINRVMLWVS